MSQAAAAATVLPQFRPADAADLIDGATVFYRGAWGHNPVAKGKIIGSGEETGEAVWDVRLANGGQRWGYIDQFQIEVR